MRTPPPKPRARDATISSPIPARRRRLHSSRRRPGSEPPPPPLEAKMLPPVMAPVAPMAADKKNQEGVLKEVPEETPPSQGSGAGGGTGTGQGTGIGEANGVRDRARRRRGHRRWAGWSGSGVDPPRLLREVRATTPTRPAGPTSTAKSCSRSSFAATELVGDFGASAARRSASKSEPFKLCASGGSLRLDSRARRSTSLSRSPWNSS